MTEKSSQDEFTALIKWPTHAPGFWPTIAVFWGKLPISGFDVQRENISRGNGHFVGLKLGL